MVGLNMISDISIHRSVVQSSEGSTPHFLRVCWVVQAVRGAILAVLVLIGGLFLAVLAPWLAPDGTVYADERLPVLIALSSFLLLMKGAESPNQFLAMRYMAIGRLALVNLTSQLVSLVSMLILGLLNPTVWALFLGTAIGAACRLALTHLALKGPRMGFEWDQRIADELWDFGKWLMGSSALTFVAGHADRLILGALLDVETFSFYTIALVWAHAAIELVNKLASNVGYPVFAKVRRERPKDRAGVFRRFTIAIDAICLSSFFVLLFFGSSLIHFLYLDHYDTSAAFIPLLAVGVLVCRFQPLSMLLLSEGDSPAMLITSAIRAVAICTCLPLCFSFFGVAGALLATSLSPLAASPFLIVRLFHVLGRRIWVDISWVVGILGVSVSLYFFSAL
jgi:O-antigen/teichoic acid export membrane protein